MRTIILAARSGLAVLLGLGASGCQPARPIEQVQPAASAVASCAKVAAADTTVYDTTQVDQRPLLRSAPPVTYPHGVHGIFGSVLLAATIDPDGGVDSASVVVTHPLHPLLDAEARRVVVGTRFSPGCRHDEAVRVRMTLPVEFPTPRPVISMREAFMIGLLGGVAAWALSGQ